MAETSRSLDEWRDYFLTADSDIFDIIEGAIKVAAVDCPKEFKSSRDRIAELLFSCKVTKCSGCDNIELAVPNEGGDREMQKEVRKNELVRETEVEAVRSTKESKVNSSGDEDDADHDVEDMGIHENLYESNYSYGDAEALTDEIEEESQIFGEVLRVKEILENSEDASESLLFDSLRRLQLLGLSVEILQATKIGRTVKVLGRHGSKQIRQLANTLVNGWKAMVDEWILVTPAIGNATGGTPESMKTSDVVDEEEGLPSPPLDEGAFFASQPMELSQFFDGMDDDGNPQNSGEFNKNRQNGRKPLLEKQSIPKQKQQVHVESLAPPNVRKVEKPKKQEITVKKEEPAMKKQTALVKPNKLALAESGPGRPPKPRVQEKINYDMKCQQKSDKGTIQRREYAPQQNKLKSSDDAKLEATKRKLQERYQEADNAKRQKKIQVMELQDLPKQSLGNRNPHFRPGNHGRHWANGRR